MRLNSKLLLLLILLATEPVALAQEPASEHECIPGGWPMVVLPVVLDGDRSSAPILPEVLQQELVRFLVEYSPFSQVTFESTDDGERLYGRFYLQPRLGGGLDGSFGTADNMAARLSIRILLADAAAPVFTGSYVARHSVSDVWTESAAVQHLLLQWKTMLLQDLHDFHATGAWERATLDWRVSHAYRQRLVIVYDSSRALAGQSLLRRVGEILEDRGCATIVWRPVPSAPRDAETFSNQSGQADADFVVTGIWDSPVGPARLTWRLRSSRPDGPGLSGQTDEVDAAWQMENGARSVAATIGAFLQADRETQESRRP